MDLAEVIEAQGEAAGETAIAPGAATDAAEARALALAHLSGRGAPRSYELASAYARLGAAMGDGGSADLLAQIDARIAGDGAFAEAEARAAAAATEAWLTRE